MTRENINSHRKMTSMSCFLKIIFPIVVLFCSGCFKHEVKDYQPKRGMVCDNVQITGSFYDIGHLDGVWFNNVPAKASFIHNPGPGDKWVIQAQVPDGATTGKLRVSISTGGGIVLGVVGTDYVSPEDFVVTGTPPAPEIISFSATPLTIKDGASSLLEWQVAPAVTQLTLNGINVFGTSSKTESPTITTTYSLKASNETCLQGKKSVMVTVVPGPKLSSLAKSIYHPGDKLQANGVSLKQISQTSALVFEGTPNLSVIDPSPSASQLQAVIPATLVSGTIKVHAVVGTDVTNSLGFSLDGRENGPFTEIKSKLNTTSQTCATKQMKISFVTPAMGWPLPVLASFTQGTATLTNHNFRQGAIGGATFSPKCDNAVSLNYQVTPDEYTCLVERFATSHKKTFTVKIIDGITTVTERWHILFSPDDKIVIVSSVPNPSASPDKIVISIYDMVQQRLLNPAIFTNCTACDIKATLTKSSQTRN